MSGFVRISTVLVVFLGMLGFGLQPISLTPTQAAMQPAHSIVGTWVSIPTASGRPPGTPDLITWISDGIYLVSMPSGSDSSGHGVWVSTGDRTVAYTSMRLRRNAGGDFIGTVKNRGTITLNATYDAYTGSGKADFFDAQGRLVRSGDYTLRGTRMKVESL